MSRFDDDSRWYEEQDANVLHPQEPAYDDLSNTQEHAAHLNEHSYSPPVQRPRRKKRAWGKYLLVTLLVLLAFCGGWFSQIQFGAYVPFGGDSAHYSQLFQQAWTTIDQNYVDRKQVNYKNMSYSAISAMVDSLHDTGHTRFLTPQQIQQENQSLSGKYTGIGITLNQNTKSQQWIVASTIPGSPADKAALTPNDILLSVNGTQVTGKPLETVSGLIQGKAGTTVTLQIQRGSEKPFTKTIARAEIAVPNVLSYYIQGSQIVDIQVIQFAEGISDDIAKQLEAAKKQGAKKIILDLRNNPGGYLQEAIDTASIFVPKGNVLLTQDSSGKRTPMPVSGKATDTQEPLVVLVNANSASAAEIVTGALKDNNRATVIGKTTFGTGTVLNQFNLADGSAILIGIQEWLTPKGQFIRDHGITPTISVDLPKDANPLTPTDEQEQHMTEQQILSGNDTQLNKAIEYLNSH